MGERLIGLPDSELAQLPLDTRLAREIAVAKTMPSRGAQRRQRQLIGKLMAAADTDAIASALDELKASERRQKAAFHDAERWRDRVLREGTPAIEAFAAEYGCAPPGLPDLLRDFGRQVDDRGRKQVSRDVFRAIHEQIAAGVPSSGR